MVHRFERELDEIIRLANDVPLPGQIEVLAVFRKRWRLQSGDIDNR